MMYRPPRGLRLWDTWILPSGNEFHLFHLQNPEGGKWDSIGHAVSTDLLRWEAREPIPMRGPEGAWDSGPLLTGVAFPHGDGYAMTFGSISPDGEQQIGVMFSPDLHEWTKYPENPILNAAPPYMVNDDWRDAYVHRIGGEYEALVCARTEDGRSCIARMRSEDLIEWTALPPVVTPETWQCEVPETFTLGGRSYLVFSVGGRTTTPARQDGSGTLYMVTDDESSPYSLPDEPILLGSGRGLRDCYVGRTIEVYGQRILYHHNCGDRPALGAPKVVRQSDDGRLWLQYWQHLNGLETETLLADLDGLGQSSTGWTRQDGALAGSAAEGTAIHLAPPVAADLSLTASITLSDSSRGGVVFTYDDASRTGFALTLDAGSGDIEIARLDGSGIEMMDSYHWPVPLHEEHTLRVFARSEFADCFVDDRLVFSAVVDGGPQSGRVGFIAARGSISFATARLAALEIGPA